MIEQLKKLNDKFITEVLVDWESELKEKEPDVNKLQAYVDDIGVRLSDIVETNEGDKLYSYLYSIVDSHRNNSNTFPHI